MRRCGGLSAATVRFYAVCTVFVLIYNDFVLFCAKSDESAGLTGCSSCIHLQNCGDYNEGLEKAAAIYILCRLLGRPCNALPSQTAEEPAAAATWTPGVKFGDAGEDPEEWEDEHGNQEDESLAPESAGRCVICLSRFATPVKTACGHVFCLGCLKQHIASSNAAASARASAGAAAASRGNAYAPGGPLYGLFPAAPPFALCFARFHPFFDGFW